jgi:thiosulfate/3-mercaptopyruvate sulfurtransferase
MIGKSMLVDARESDGYFGLTQAPWEKRRGHIPTAKSLPAPWMWNLVEDKNGVITYGTYKDGNVVKEIVSTVIGKDRDKEIIVYCGLGGYASTVCYILTQVAGHKNVKFFDGSMQEWTGDPKAQVVKYRYQ